MEWFSLEMIVLYVIGWYGVGLILVLLLEYIDSRLDEPYCSRLTLGGILLGGILGAFLIIGFVKLIGHITLSIIIANPKCEFLHVPLFRNKTDRLREENE